MKVYIILDESYSYAERCLVDKVFSSKEKAIDYVYADYMKHPLFTGKSKEDLIGDIIALLQSPAKNVISGLQANAGQKIAGLVKALEERG